MVLIVHVIPQFFNYHEYTIVRNKFPNSIVLAQSRKPIVEFARDEPYAGVRVDAQLLSEFHEIPDIFIQTSGSVLADWRLFADKDMQRILKETYDNGGIVAAICNGIVSITNSIDVRGKRLTGFPMANVAKEIYNKGARYTAKPVEVDDRIITAFSQIEVYDWVCAIEKRAKELGILKGEES